MKRMMSLGSDLELYDDGIVRLRAARGAEIKVAKAAQLPRRYNIPKTHHLYGTQTVSVVPSGMGDCTLDDEGRLVPYTGDASVGARRVDAGAEELRRE